MAEASKPWVDELVGFLQARPGVGAVRFDPSARKIAVATLGRIDLADLETKLAETIAANEAAIAAAENSRGPFGYSLRREGASVILQRDSCITAERLWLWREMKWPQFDPEEKPEWRLLAAMAATCGAAGLAGAILERAAPGAPYLGRGLLALALVAGGWDAAIDTWQNLRRREIDIHFLMLAVAVGAVAIGGWGEAVLLLFLFSASGAMEEYALHRTRSEVRALLTSAPKRATLALPGGAEQEVPVESLKIGQKVRVKPGEAFPADATVASGRSAADESALTGEATPVPKEPGDEVYSGTLNLWGVVEADVTRLPAESTLQKIIRLIQTAQKLRAPSERFTDRFGTGYTYAVLGVSAGMFLLWWLGLHLPAFENQAGVRSAFYRAMTLMVVASPCALVLSIPSAILAAIAWGARHGVLFRGGAALEKLAEIRVVALDKTGTLTTGELSVVAVESYPAGRELEVLELACALETKSHHPIARAIVRHAKERGAAPREVEDFRSLTGQGVSGRVDGSKLLLGRRELLEAGPLAPWARQLPEAAAESTEVWVIGRDLVGRILLKDQIRQESSAVLAELRAAGIRTVMLTGDRRHAAEAVARELGLDDVRAGLSPEGKVEAIQAIRRQVGVIAMVGDGVNDAPCLAASDVGAAMGARGSDAALEQAEVILMHDRIESFLAAHRLSLRTRAVIRQNLTVALGVVVVMVTATAVGSVPLAAGVAAHEGSTLVVCLNSLRLLWSRNRPGRRPSRSLGG